MKRLSLFFTAALVPLDYFALILAALTAYTLRFSPYFRNLRAVSFDLPFHDYIAVVIWLALVWILVFSLIGLYTTRPPSLAAEITRIFYGVCTAAAAVLAIAFFSRQLFDSRFIFLAGWALAFIYLCLERLSVRLLQRILRKLGYGLTNLALIGSGAEASELQKYLNNYARFGYRITASFSKADASTLDQLAILQKNGDIEGLLLVENDLSREMTDQLFTFANNNHLAFLHLAALFPTASQRPLIHIFAGLPVIEIPKTPLDGWGSIYKRLFDLFFAALGLIILSPFLLCAAIISLIEDGWPVIFANERIGRRGVIFNVYKLRTMWRKYSIGPQFTKDNQANLALEQKLIVERSQRQGPLYKVQNDPRITPFGRFLRKASIDEFPQLWNVIIGNMSLVGPRPHQPREVDKYEPHERRVLTIKPGITGLAQISGRANLSFSEEVQLDMHYIENWSPLLDLIIIAKTPIAMIFSRDAA